MSSNLYFKIYFLRHIVVCLPNKYFFIANLCKFITFKDKQPAKTGYLHLGSQV